MSRRPRFELTAVALTLASTLRAPLANAEHRAVAPAGPGLDTLEVVLDPEVPTLKVRRCRASDCSDTGTSKTIPIPIHASRVDVARATVEAVPIGEGKSVVLARVPDAQRKDLAFEAILAGRDGDPIFAGLTGYTRGEDGDRSGHVVRVYDRDARSKFVLVAEAREDSRICGQTTTPLGARGLDPKTMQLRGATLHRLEKGARDGAVRVVARSLSRTAAPPIARLLVATGGSAPGAQSLTDGDPDTSWSETRPGDGHGEFVTMRAPSEVPIHSIALTIAPSSPTPDGAAPRTFFLATDQQLFHVTVPEDGWLKPGSSYEIPLPDPIRTTCLALVLDEAYPRGHGAPEVSIAEVAALSKFDVDGATVDDLARELSTGRAEEATGILRRAGDEGIAAATRRWDAFDGPARALAVDVAASAGTCAGAAMDLLTRALADKEAEVKKRAIGRVERCGKAATESLVAAVRSGDEARRAAVAPLLATISPAAALAPISDELGKGSPETRRALRAAITRASASSPRHELIALVAKRDVSPSTRLDLLRAMGSKLPELRPESAAAIADVLRSSPDMPTRFLVAEPLAQLARSPDATRGELTRLVEMARRDPDWPVRARAVELASEIPPLASTVIAATGDPEPRVREAALNSVALGKLSGAADDAARALASDPWTFVRVAAAQVLGVLPSARGPSALVRALGDQSPRVRAAAISALGSQRAASQAGPIRARLDDAKEDIEVRALAARTLGTMCVRSAIERLTQLALRARSPIDEADERVGVAAIEALAMLHPADLDKRLAPLRAKEARTSVRLATTRAMSTPGACH